MINYPKSTVLIMLSVLQVATAASRLDVVPKIKDPEIRKGVELAIQANMLPAATQQHYTGSFEITAGPSPYLGATWPGLDSWQMAGAYLMLGRTQLVLDYFEFVRASQRKDGAIPMAIFPAGVPAQTFLRGLKYPDDVFTYNPPKREGVPPSGLETRAWIGMYQQWELKANCMSSLGSVCYILTAAEIYDDTHSYTWLLDHYKSIQAAAEYLLSRRETNGLIAGSGFYSELPPRYAWDGVTQCYTIHAFRELARLAEALQELPSRDRWLAEAAALQQSFTEIFWNEDHFGEYVHPRRGLVDAHGLSDVNWAAVAFGLVDGERLALLWSRLTKERGFWVANVPTLTVSKPFTYEEWELNEKLPFDLPISRVNEVAAMGRVWYLEASAYVRMKEWDRLKESVRLVCRLAPDGDWRERYHPNKDGTVTPANAKKYCEYPSVLLRIVLGHPEVFTEQ